MFQFRILEAGDVPEFSRDLLDQKILARRADVPNLSETERENRRALRASLSRKYSSDLKTVRRYNPPSKVLKPIVDTVRFAWPASSKVLDEFFRTTDSKGNLIVKREGGKILSQYEKWRTDFDKSWYGHMRFFRQFQKDEKGKNSPYELMVVEYSYHKWFMISNGLNCNLSSTFSALFNPVEDSLACLGMDERFIMMARKSATLRRLDLSLNYSVNGCTVQDYLKTMSRCCIQYQDEARVYGKYDSVYWGSENSAFMIKFYDKKKEQLKLCKNFSTTEEYREFVKENLKLIENTVRFEVTFRPRWWNILEYKNEVGETMPLKNAKENDINKIIDLASVKWAQLQERIFSQIGMENASFDDQMSLAKLKIQIENSSFSGTVQRSLVAFSYDCLEKGYKNLSKDATFYRYKKILKEKFNWDLKIQSCKLQKISEEAKQKAGVSVHAVLPDQCPIMYSMSTNKAWLSIADFYEIQKAV